MINWSKFNIVLVNSIVCTKLETKKGNFSFWELFTCFVTTNCHDLKIVFTGNLTGPSSSLPMILFKIYSFASERRNSEGPIGFVPFMVQNLED